MNSPSLAAAPKNTGGVMKPKIVIVDHDLLFSEVIRLCLEQHGMSVVACPRTGEEGISACHKLQPDVALINLDLSDADGIKVGKSVREHCAGAKLLLITNYGSVSAARQATRAGFRACIAKATTSLAQFVHVIEAAMNGKENGNGNDRIPRGFRQVRESSPIGDPGVALLVDQLTPREFTVLHLLARGMGSRDIAAQVQVSPNTVRTHVQGILTKLQVHSRLEAVAFAIRHGIVEGSAYMDAM